MKTTLLLSALAVSLTAGIAPSSVSARARAAVPHDTSRFTNIEANCPVMEGYPDCHPSGREGWHIYSR
jgi:hypothetical protein